MSPTLRARIRKSSRKRTQASTEPVIYSAATAVAEAAARARRAKSDGDKKKAASASNNIRASKMSAASPSRSSSATPATNAAAAPLPIESRRHRVLIIGAGISGLSAARELLERRYDVLVLEARHRPGGRLRTVPMRIPRNRQRHQGGQNINGDATGSRKAGTSARADTGARNMEEDEGGRKRKETNGKKMAASSGEKGSGGGSSERTRRDGRYQSVDASVAARTAASSANVSSANAAAQPSGRDDGEKRQTRGAMQRQKMEGRRATRSLTSTPTKQPARFTSSTSSGGGAAAVGSSGAGSAAGKVADSSSARKRKHRPVDIGSSSVSGPASAASKLAAKAAAAASMPTPTHPLDQRYSSALFARENSRTDIDYELIPVDLGGAFIHGTGIDSYSAARTAAAAAAAGGSSSSSATSAGAAGGGRGSTSSAAAKSRLDWSSSTSKGGSKGKLRSKRSSTINPLYSLTKSMGLETVPMDGCTLMDRDGRSVDDVRASSSSIGRSVTTTAKKKAKKQKGKGGDKDGEGNDIEEDPSLDDFVQQKFNQILDDCHRVAKEMKKLERAASRAKGGAGAGTGTAGGGGSRKRRRLLDNGDDGASSKKAAAAAAAAAAAVAANQKICVKLPDGSVATPQTDFATVFNAIASTKSIFLNGNDTLPADLFSWHLNNLEMSCGAPFPSLGLKWNEDERYNYGGDHVVLPDGWGRVVEGLVLGDGGTGNYDETAPVDILYGVEVTGIRIVPPEGYDGEPVSDVEDQSDDLSDYELVESDDDESSNEGEEENAKNASANTAKAAAVASNGKRKQSSTAKKKATGKSPPVPQTPPPSKRAKHRIDGATTPSSSWAVSTRSRSKPKIRRSSRSNIGKVGTDSVYSPTFESDLTPRKGIPGKNTASSAPGGSSRKCLQAKRDEAFSHVLSNHRSVNNSTVQIRTKSADGTVQTYEADHVILTVPLGILQIPCNTPGHITFSPPLPRYKRESIANIGFGKYNKIALAFPYRFWDEEENDDFWGMAAGDEDKLGGSILAVDLGRAHKKSMAGGKTSVDDKGDIPVMLLIFGGSYASKMESLPDEEIVGEAMAVVRNAWGGKVNDVPNPIDYSVTRWGMDIYSRGSFSFVPPGVDGYVEALKISRPIFDPYPSIPTDGSKKKSPKRSSRAKSDRPMILFAGEHTTSFHPSTIHGAYLSGIREAYRLDLTLEPSMNRHIQFDKKCVYDRTFDMNWKEAVATTSINTLMKGKRRKKQTQDALDVSSENKPVEDIAILRGAEVHGDDTDGMTRIGSLMFPLPGDSSRRITGKALGRRYHALVEDGCNNVNRASDDKTWLARAGDGEETDFDWDDAAAVEADEAAAKPSY